MLKEATTPADLHSVCKSVLRDNLLQGSGINCKEWIMEGLPVADPPNVFNDDNELGVPSRWTRLTASNVQRPGTHLPRGQKFLQDLRDVLQHGLTFDQEIQVDDSQRISKHSLLKKKKKKRSAAVIRDVGFDDDGIPVVSMLAWRSSSTQRNSLRARARHKPGRLKKNVI